MQSEAPWEGRLGAVGQKGPRVLAPKALAGQPVGFHSVSVHEGENFP